MSAKKDNPKQKGQRYTANNDLRLAMRERGVTQQMLSDELGIAISTLNKWMKYEMPEMIQDIIMDTVVRIGGGGSQC